MGGCMYWLYFARDFYRAGHGASALAAAMPVSEASQPVPAASRKRAEYQPKRQPEFVVRSAEICVSPVAHRMESEAAAAPAPLAAYLQRLSVDGEHAFGVWDEEAGFSLFSANFDRITGLSSGECAGHEWIHQIHHTQQYAVNEALLGALEGRDGQCLVQAARLQDGAETRWLLMDVKAARGRGQNIMVLFRDLSEQKALEAALKQTESALAVSERSRAAFLSSMSHELRTPLNAIMGFSEMMKSAVFGELGNPTYKEYAKHIHESGNALLGKINDLLDIASMDAGGLQLEESEFHVSGMLNEAIEIHSHHAFARQQKLTLDCPHSLEMLGDRAKLMCAVSHLITNALRHSGEGAEVTVSLRIQPDEGVIISVRDAGEGISNGQLEMIRQALAADVAYFNIESGGMGLGLALTKELAQRHGGRVMIDSLRHRGTVVSMILPTARVTHGMPKRRRVCE